MLILPRRFTQQQPPAGAAIDWSNPLTRGLRFAATPLDTCNLVDGQRLTLESPADYGVAARPAGMSVVGSQMRGPEHTSSSTREALLYDVPVLTALVVASQDAATNSESVFGRGNGSPGEAWNLGLHGGSFNGGNAQLGTFAYGGRIGGPSTLQPLVVLLRGDGATAQVYENGTLAVSGSYTAPVYEYGLSYHRMNFGAINIRTGVASPTKPALGLMWGRFLSDAEVLAISLNPWQIFAWVRRVFVPQVTAPVPLVATRAQFSRRMSIKAWW